MGRKKTTIWILGLLLLVPFIGCSTRDIEIEIRQLEARRRSALNTLNQQYPGNSTAQIRAEQERRLPERNRTLHELKHELAQISSSGPQIRAISAKYSDIKVAFDRFESQLEEIRKQDQIFNRKRDELRYAGTSIATRSLQQEIKDINTNVLNQITIQQAWHSELSMASTQQLRSISYKPYRDIAENRFQELLGRNEQRMNSLKVIQTRHEEFHSKNRGYK